MRVLVTGATGFFGPEIMARLRSAGHEVVGASRHGGKGEGIEALDITSPESCARVLDAAGPIEAVVHAAALAHLRPGKVSARLCHLVNTTGTENVLDAAVKAGVRRFVFISSVMVYGDFDLPRPVTESEVCRANGIYGRAKLLAEAACLARREAVSVHVLRMATMYSPDWLVNIRKRVRPLLTGRPFYFKLDPLSRRYSLCSRRNGAEAALWALEERVSGGVYNVADHYDYCQQEILRAVERVDGDGWHVPIPVAIPRAMWRAVRYGVPFPRLRAGAYSRYWKFCEYNLYSAEKLWRLGFEAPPDLLSLGKAG